MFSTSERVTGKTVPTRLTLVNTFVPVNAELPDTPGGRLRDFIDARWTRRNGGMRGLAKKLATSAETMYAWFRDEHEPSLDHLTRLADALTEATKTPVSRAEILAVMDGGTPLVPLDAATEANLTLLVNRLLDERLGPR